MSDTQELPEPFSEKEIAMLIRNLEETSHNEGSSDLACRCADALIVIRQLQAALAANSEPVATAWAHRGMWNFDPSDELSALDDGKGTPIKLYAHPLPQEGCEWKLDDEESGTWSSSCGELWSFIDGGPKENRVSYCHHCGGKVHIAAAKDESKDIVMPAQGAKGFNSHESGCSGEGR